MLRAGLQPFWQNFIRILPRLAAVATTEASEARTEVRPAPPSGLLLESVLYGNEALPPLRPAVFGGVDA